ncbi:hypothetical protein BpHYR1_048015 [Brachionus plicatilis]|uniref:Uncharacterized protein n=1 Tax=Brachionus plicatilis TaxID=10195 RepID=A0A3M7T9H4_BRAPC|nr:hypothetical protein BpHYR1_048015 [Brachionus plicatilis]
MDGCATIYKIKRDWDGVSSLTIQRCFRKAGFNGDFLFGDLESECNENDDFKEIWTMLMFQSIPIYQRVVLYQISKLSTEFQILRTKMTIISTKLSQVLNCFVLSPVKTAQL